MSTTKDNSHRHVYIFWFYQLYSKTYSTYYARWKNQHILIVSSGINFIDLSGAEALIAENTRLKAKGGGIYFVGLKSSVNDFLVDTGFVKEIGHNHFFETKEQAIQKIYEKLNLDICYSCEARVFKECSEKE